MTINNFSIEYDAINSKNIFTNGDTINGRIIVEVSKETKIQSLVFRATGKANVRWSEHYGQGHHHVYWSDEKYYDIKQPILRETRQDGNVFNQYKYYMWYNAKILSLSAVTYNISVPGSEVIGKGRHVFPFSFNVPDRCLLFT